MSSPFANPLIRYGLGLSSAAILAAVAFFFLDGTIQLLVFALAAFEAVFLPYFLKVST